MKKNSYVLFLLLSIAFAVDAQDIHFSQFNENASLVNPALMGQANTIKASVIYKDQWRSVTVPYKTIGAELELRFNQRNKKSIGRQRSRKGKKIAKALSAGLSFFSDKAGDGDMGTTIGNFSLAANLPVTRKASLALGMQASIVQKSINYSKLVWPGQYDGTGYDQHITSGEDLSGGNFTYPDFAAGVLWSYGYADKSIGSNEQFKMDVGFSIYHFNTPKLKFVSETEEKLFSKEVVHAKFLFGVPDRNISVLPSCIIQFQGPSTEFIIGSLIRYSLKNDTKYTGNKQASYAGLGLYYRNNDAFVATAQFDFHQFGIGFSYDFNTSDLRTVSSVKGGFEVYLRFNARAAYLYQR